MLKKITLTTLLLTSIVFAQNERFKNYNHFFEKDRASSEVVGYSDTYFLDASSANATPPTTDNSTFWGNCRGISADSTGVVKIDYVNEAGTTITEVVMLVQGIIRPVRNVRTLYRYYVGTTAGTAKSYNSSGTITTNAIKLHR